MYKWHWVRSSFYTNVYGYFPDRIDVMETTKLNPNIPVIDCVHHYIETVSYTHLTLPTNSRV